MPRRDSDDDFEIRRLITRYAMALDRRDTTALSDCFTPDAEFVVSQQARLDVPDADCDLRYGPGWSNLEELFTRTAAMFTIGTHFLGQTDVLIDDDAAAAESYGISFAVPLGTTELIMRGVRYIDDLRRTDDGWRIRTRTLALDWASTAVTSFVQPFSERVRGLVPC